jgi:hypothetical protein
MGMGGFGGFPGQGGGQGRAREAWESEDSEIWDPEGPEMPAVGADGMIGDAGAPAPAFGQEDGFASRPGRGRDSGATRGAADGERAARAQEDRLRALMSAKGSEGLKEEIERQRRKWLEEDPDAWGPEGYGANSVPTEPRAAWRYDT